MDLLQRDINLLSSPSPELKARSLGHAYGLAGLFSVVPERPLYISQEELCSRVIEMAIKMLKAAGEHELNVAVVEVEVGWTLIGSIMALGPGFVRGHLTQLLVLWRNALPKPTTKDLQGGRAPAEWMFLLHVRECALGAVLSFLRHNSPTLVTLDVARRISTLLSNALGFANAFVTQHREELSEQQPLPSNSISSSGVGSEMTVSLREALLRRRVYQCFTALGFGSLTEAMQSSLLQSCMSLFASSEGFSGSSVQAAIASSSGTFGGVWTVGDGYGYGVTSLDIDDEGLSGDESGQGETAGAGSGSSKGEKKDQLNRDLLEVSLENLVSHSS